MASNPPLVRLSILGLCPVGESIPRIRWIRNDILGLRVRIMTGFGVRWKNFREIQNSLRAHHDGFSDSLKKLEGEDSRTACARIMTDFQSR